MSKLSVKNLISIHDLTVGDVKEIMAKAAELKGLKRAGKPHDHLKNKTLAMIFEKPSLRTRISFEVGMLDLGGSAVTLSQEEVNLGIRESAADVAMTLSRYVDAVMIRTFSHSLIIEMAKHSSVPIINGLSDLLHPCQALSDLFTIMEKKPVSKSLKVAYIGDGNNVCHSLMFAAAKGGFSLFVASPKGYEPDKAVTKAALEDAKAPGVKISVSNDPAAAAKHADVIYTDVWASMGKEKEAKKRKKTFKGFQINSKLVKLAKKDAIIMHCLPAHRGEEITAEVIDGLNSVIFDQAENRLHVQKAVLALLL